MGDHLNKEVEFFFDMGLDLIKARVQKYADAMSSALEMGLTMADHRFIRIAGTGKYKEWVSERIPQGSFFEVSIRESKSFLIENPGRDPPCRYCEKKRNSFEAAETCVPIMLKDRNAVGAIGIIAFDKAQRNLFLRERKLYFEFLLKMSVPDYFIIDKPNTSK